MAEVNDVNIWNLLIGVLKYVITGFISVIGLFLLWMIGKLNSIMSTYKNQFDEMYSHYTESTGKNAMILQNIKEEEWKSVLATLKEMSHDINGLRQEKANKEILLRESSPYKKE